MALHPSRMYISKAYHVAAYSASSVMYWYMTYFSLKAVLAVKYLSQQKPPCSNILRRTSVLWQVRRSTNIFKQMTIAGESACFVRAKMGVVKYYLMSWLVLSSTSGRTSSMLCNKIRKFPFACLARYDVAIGKARAGADVERATISGSKRLMLGMLLPSAKAPALGNGGAICHIVESLAADAPSMWRPRKLSFSLCSGSCSFSSCYFDERARCRAISTTASMARGAATEVMPGRLCGRTWASWSCCAEYVPPQYLIGHGMPTSRGNRGRKKSKLCASMCCAQAVSKNGWAFIMSSWLCKML